jgi:FlaA1/EpsC-like NDP-sugar epimerase
MKGFLFPGPTRLRTSKTSRSNHMGLKRTPRFLLLTLGYTAVLTGCFVLSLLLRFEGIVPARHWDGAAQILPWFVLLSLVGYFVAGLYHGLWRYASTVTLFQVFKGATLSAAALVLVDFFQPAPLFPRSIIPMVWVWEIVVLGAMRFAWRLSRERVLSTVSPLRAVRTLVVGADPTGVHLIQEMRRLTAGAETLVPVGFIDDDPRLTGGLVEGIKVRGTIADLARAIQETRAEMVVVSDADMPAKVVREIARFCGEANVRIKTLPGLSDLQQGRTTLSQMRDVRIEDLLGRQPVQLNVGELAEFLRGQRVMVTGAGGSIGSELARQVAGFDPAELVLLDHAETGSTSCTTSSPRSTPGSSCTRWWPTCRTKRASISRSTGSGRTWCSTRPRTSTCRCSRPTRVRRCSTTSSGRATWCRRPTAPASPSSCSSRPTRP